MTKTRVLEYEKYAILGRRGRTNQLNEYRRLVPFIINQGTHLQMSKFGHFRLPKSPPPPWVY